MTTLTGNDLFEYLNHLEQEVTKRQAQHGNNTLAHTIHEFMGHLLNAEQKYLNHINPNKDNAMLSFADNGLPSIESFNADLNSMLKEESLDLIDSKYQKSSESEYDPNNFHKSVSEESFQEIFENYEIEKLRKEYKFEIIEKEEGEFNLFFHEESYLDAVDAFSRNNPVFVRLGNVSYDVKWNKLFVKNEGSFYVPLEENVGRSNLPVIVNSGILFDEISYSYPLKSKHMIKQEVPSLFGKKKKMPENYQSLISAGYNARLNVLTRVKDVLSEGFQNEIFLTETKDEKETVISTEKSVFLNDIAEREKIPHSHSFESIQYNIKKRSKNGIEKIGTIKLTLPYLWNTEFRRHCSYGDVKINIQKEAITDSPLNFNLLLNLKPKKIMRKLLK